MRKGLKNLAVMAITLGTLAFQAHVNAADYNDRSNNYLGNPPYELNADFGNNMSAPSSYNAPNSYNAPSNYNTSNNHNGYGISTGQPPFSGQSHFGSGHFPVNGQGYFNPAVITVPYEPPQGASAPDHYDVLYQYDFDMNVYRDSTFMKYEEATKRCEELKKYKDVHSCDIKWWFSRPYQYQAQARTPIN